MPSPTPVKFRGSMVRQHSLQNQIPVQSPGRLKLKKQYSEDDSRLLDPVEVTGQRWLPHERSDSILRIGGGEGKIMQTKVNGSKPKPAKVAWAEKRQDSSECRADVEVVATKCHSQPRPLSVKVQRFRNPLLGNKDTLVYSRIQLAERLRNAWNEREKIKPNLNIFLAHASNSTRSDSASIDGHQDIASTLSDSMEKIRKPLQMRAFSQDYCPPELFQNKLKVSSFGLKPQGDSFKKENDEAPCLSKNIVNAANDENKSFTQETRCLQELNKIEIRITKNEETPSSDFSANKENLETNYACEPNEDNESEKAVKSIITAEDRRAKFRSSSILHKTITESFSSALTSEEEKLCEENDAKKSTFKKVLIRALSAPSHDQNYQKENFPQKTVKFQPPKRLQPAVGSDASVSIDDVNTTRERIKSAPVRRKLKTAAVRRKNKDKGESSSEEEKEAKEATTKSKKATRRTRLKNGNDIITMVSLVSPAETDVEDSVINLPMESLPVRDDKEEKTGQLKPPREQGVQQTSFVVQKLVSLRKPTKTVTFQHPVLSRNYSASFPSRRAPAGTPFIIPSPVISNPTLTPAQLQERDKRSPMYAGMDGRGIKRRLMRSPSEPVKEEDSYENNNRKPCETLSEDFPQFPEEISEKEVIEGDSENGIPQFKCPKEKECWTLYKKMVAKGVSVTFDTVLRGMLTPTEYRLKKNRLLSTG